MMLKIRKAINILITITSMMALIIVLFLFVGRMSEHVVIYGYIDFNNKYAVKTKTEGVVKKLFVKEGDTVRENDTLAIIDNQDIKLSKEKLEQDIYSLEKENNGYKKKLLLIDSPSYMKDKILKKEAASIKCNNKEQLYKNNLISKDEYDQAKLEYDLQKAEMENAMIEAMIEKNGLMSEIIDNQKKINIAKNGLIQVQNKINGTIICAPCSGTIITSEVMKLDGSYYNIGETLFEIADIKDVYLKCEASEKEITKLKIGQRAHVFMNALPYRKYKIFYGDIREIAAQPLLSSKGVIYIVRVNIIEPWIKVSTDDEIMVLMLKPGMTAKIEIFVSGYKSIINILFRNMLNE